MIGLLVSPWKAEALREIVSLMVSRECVIGLVSGV